MEQLDNDKEPLTVPYIVYEGELARCERHIRKLWILCILIFALFVITNALWLNYEMSFEDVQTSVRQEITSESGNAVIYGDKAGAVIYGYDDTDDYNAGAAAKDRRQ